MNPETLEVVITPDDIQQGKRYCSITCPIALAAQRAIRVLGLEPLSLFITPAMLVLRYPEGDYYYPLPAVARDFQLRFDRAAWDDTDPGLEPFAFEVRWDQGFPSKGNLHRSSANILLP